MRLRKGHQLLPPCSQLWGRRLVEPAWLWYSQSRTATPLDMEKYGRFDFSPWKRKYLARNRPKSMMAYAEVKFVLFRFQFGSLLRPWRAHFQRWSLNLATKVLGYKHLNMCGPITTQHVFQAWNILRCVLCCDWPIKKLNQSAGEHTNERRTFVGKLSDHLGKRGSPDLDSAWNWNLNRQNSTSYMPSSILAGFGPDICVFRVKIESPLFSMSRGVAVLDCEYHSQAVSFLRHDIEKRLRAV